MSPKTSFPREKVKVLLLENIHKAAVDRFKDAGYSVETKTKALSKAELNEAIKNVHILGIRSKTSVTKDLLSSAKQLLSVGCFCIGTDQVALDNAQSAGVPVFNAPFSNTRSVAELTIAEIVMLARRAAHKSMLLHAGKWDKSADGCCEVRQKTIGIIGYGHIGPQVGLLAEAFGMKVIFYDILPKLPLGNAQRAKNMNELLAESDFVTLHVPDTKQTKNLIGKDQLKKIKKGGFLLNLSRGSVVDIEALFSALKSRHIAGAALDVFPDEPASNDEEFLSQLRGMENVILTPHIGGSTEEAQKNIGLEVADAMLKYIETGSTTGAVNFPAVELPIVQEYHRVLNIHKNVPGVLKNINQIVASMGVNIQAQYLNTKGDVGYLIMDVDRELSKGVKAKLDKLQTNIRTRLLF